jgi:hypothetical protein
VAGVSMMMNVGLVVVSGGPSTDTTHVEVHVDVDGRLGVWLLGLCLHGRSWNRPSVFEQKPSGSDTTGRRWLSDVDGLSRRAILKRPLV